jgi:hypothetical protein
MEYLSMSLACDICHDKASMYTIQNTSSDLDGKVICEDCAKKMFPDSFVNAVED